MPSYYLLSKDLLFSSRVQSSAEAAGIPLQIVSGQQQLQQHVGNGPCRLVLLDLTYPQLDPASLLGSLRDLTDPPRTIIAFGPHVRRDQLSAAREAGCDEVLSRGEFNQRLPDFFAEFVVQAE